MQVEFAYTVEPGPRPKTKSGSPAETMSIEDECPFTVEYVNFSIPEQHVTSEPTY